MSVELFEALRSLRKVARVPEHSANPVSRWWQRSTTEHELQCLSDRDLADIGVARRDISKVARAGLDATAEPQKDPTPKRHKSKTFGAEDSFDNVIAFQQEDCEAADVPQDARKLFRRGVQRSSHHEVRQIEHYQSHSP